MRCLGCGYALWNLTDGNCPECGRHHGGVGKNYLPSDTSLMTCRGCGQVIVTGQMQVVLLADDPQRAEAGSAHRVPWEQTGKDARLMRCWWRTFRMSLAHPRELGQRIDSHASGDPDVSLYTLLVFVLAGAHLWVWLGVDAILAALTGNRRLVQDLAVLGSYFCLTALWPLLALWFVLCFFVLPAHLLLRISGQVKRTLKVTAGSILYAQGPWGFAPLAVMGAPY